MSARLHSLFNLSRIEELGSAKLVFPSIMVKTKIIGILFIFLVSNRSALRTAHPVPTDSQ